VKLAIESAAKGRALLRRFRYAVLAPRVFEENFVLDDDRLSLFESGRLLRLRRAGKTVRCTSKTPEASGRHKRREEQEFEVSDLDACLGLFAALGYRERFRYEKYRTEFSRKGEPGHVTLDETPIGSFMELEGPPRWIDETAKILGFTRDAYITTSYGGLYFLWCEEHGIAPSNMLF
jgi:adenylate cyclase class 2